MVNIFVLLSFLCIWQYNEKGKVSMPCDVFVLDYILSYHTYVFEYIPIAFENQKSYLNSHYFDFVVFLEIVRQLIR